MSYKNIHNYSILLFSGNLATVKEVQYKGTHAPVEIVENFFDVEGIIEENNTKVFNFEVEGWHTYFVGWLKVLVHNTGICIKKSVENLFKFGREYLKQIAKITGRKVHPKQLAKIKDALRNKEFKKLSKEATAKSRAEFNKVKDKLIKDWEKETGQIWPRYDKDVLSKKGEAYLKKGDAYDAHHIIENTHGGPHEWWNIHPASNPTQHQAGIHGKDGISKFFFGN